MKDEYRVSDLPIRQINKVFIENFYLYIIKNHDCSPNTAMKFIQRFRTVVNFAQGTGLITADPFVNYKLKFEYIERGYLDKDEISRICNKDFASKRLEQVRDIFIFSCYTGLSYVDICELTSNDIRLAFDDNLWIIKKRHKTKVTSNIRLLDIPKAILNKYEGKLKNGQLLPVISNQKMNDYLKEIAVLCGIDKNITFHLAHYISATSMCSISKGIHMLMAATPSLPTPCPTKIPLIAVIADIQSIPNNVVINYLLNNLNTFTLPKSITSLSIFLYF